MESKLQADKVKMFKVFKKKQKRQYRSYDPQLHVDWHFQTNLLSLLPNGLDFRGIFLFLTSCFLSNSFLEPFDTLNALWFDEITCLLQQNTEKTNFLKFLVPPQLQGHYNGQVRTVISQHHNHHKVTKDLIQLLPGLKDLSKIKKIVKKIFTT